MKKYGVMLIIDIMLVWLVTVLVAEGYPNWLIAISLVGIVGLAGGLVSLLIKEPGGGSLIVGAFLNILVFVSLGAVGLDLLTVGYILFVGTPQVSWWMLIFNNIFGLFSVYVLIRSAKTK